VIRAGQRHATPSAELPENAAPAVERDLDLSASLATLTERQRLTVLYHHLGGLSYREVAILVGGTPEAARRAAADGIAALRTTHPREQPHRAGPHVREGEVT
jgi:DNA-directed RNA polymerase specialized sigma24 family protein